MTFQPDIARPGSFADWAERTRIFKDIAAILAAHDFCEEKGLCTDLGRHENNPLCTIYFHEYESAGTAEFLDQDTLFTTSAQERSIFGAPEGMTIYAVSTDDNGFVYGRWLDERRAQYLRDAYAEQEGLTED